MQIKQLLALHAMSRLLRKHQMFTKFDKMKTTIPQSDKNNPTYIACPPVMQIEMLTYVLHENTKLPAPRQEHLENVCAKSGCQTFEASTLQRRYQKYTIRGQARGAPI